MANSNFSLQKINERAVLSDEYRVEHRLPPADSDIFQLLKYNRDLLTALKNCMIFFAQSDENSIDRFERIAAIYYQETGRLAPGKDISAAAADDTSYEKRRELYDEWVEGKLSIARAAIRLAEPEGTDNGTP